MRAPRKIGDMLDYENQMFLDILNEDGLVITAKGLGLEDVFLNLLKVYSDPGNLVLVLGTTHHEEAFYMERLVAEGVNPLPRIITSESGSSAERKNLYLQGGVLFLSPRILVVDLLKDRLPVTHVTGIMVYRAHSIMRSCQEAFAVRLYRQKNKTGFVKAFSNSAEAFTQGFCHVSRIMKTLFLKRLYLWPRFQAIVQSSLAVCKPLVEEMHVQLTPAMTRIQNAVLELMAFTVKELKRINPSMDFEELTVENAIAKSFHKILQGQLDPVWHQLSEKTKTLVSDLKLLRVFLNYLTRYDCVTFNTFVSSFRTQTYALSSSGWLLLEPANVMFTAARQRVEGGGNGQKSSKPKKKLGKAAAVMDEDDDSGDVDDDLKTSKQLTSSRQRARRGKKKADDDDSQLSSSQRARRGKKKVEDDEDDDDDSLLTLSQRAKRGKKKAEDDDDSQLSSSQRAKRGKKKDDGGSLRVVSPVKYSRLRPQVVGSQGRSGGKEKDTLGSDSEGEEEGREEKFGEDGREEKRDEERRNSNGKEKAVETGGLEDKKDGVDLEPSPKWVVLRQILAEIKTVSRETREDVCTADKVLILVQDKRTAKQLQDLLLYGSRAMLRRLRDRCANNPHRVDATSRHYEQPHARSPTRAFQRHEPRLHDTQILLSTQLLGGDATQRDLSGAGEQSEKESGTLSKSGGEGGEVSPSKGGEVSPSKSEGGVGEASPLKVGEVSPSKSGEVSQLKRGEVSPLKRGAAGEVSSTKGGAVGEEMEAAADEYRDVYILSQRPWSEGERKEGGGSNEEEGDDKYEVIAEKLEDLDCSWDVTADPPPAASTAASTAPPPPVVIIQTFKADGDPLSLPRTLDEARPRFIVLYDVDVAAIRRVEVYQCVLPSVQIRVYFVVFGGSVEEQAYLTALRREKEAFEFLIREKATMVIPADQDGRSDTCEALSRDAGVKPGEGGGNTRQGAAAAGADGGRQATIVVDMREFNSELPAMIHRRGIEVDPVTLQIGDYVLSPDICVERKSISDLIGSLNNGRLYNQAKAMTRYYTNPMLLIEFDQHKPMTLQGNYYISKDMSSNDVSAKLILLTLHFPRLKIVWSPSPYATAQLFEELKQIRDEPDPVKAASVGDDLEQDLDLVEKYNPAIHDLVARLPGVTTRNIPRLLSRGQSLDHLATLSKDKLRELLGSIPDGDCLFDGIHKPFNPEEEAEAAKRGAGRWGRGRGRGFKRPA